MCKLSNKTSNFEFFDPNLPKTDFWLEIQKTNVGIRITFIEIPCLPIFGQNEQLWLFWPKFAQKSILGSEFQKTNVGIRISILEIPCVPIFRQNGQFCLFGPKFAQNGSWGWNFKNLDSESAPPRYHMCQFSVKMDNFEFFGLNLGKLPNYVRYFGSNVVEDVAESWVEVEMSWLEVDGARWRLKWRKWRWRAGWSWVELGALISNTRTLYLHC